MNILVTGITGFFGKALIKYFIKLNNQQVNDGLIRVVGLSRNPTVFFKKNPEYSNLNWLKLIKADITSRESISRLNGNFTHLIHLAVDSTMGPNLSGLDRFDQIYAGARNILDLAVSDKIGSILLASSGGVYGEMPEKVFAFSESSPLLLNPLNANNTYSLAKIAVEHLALLYQRQYELNIKIARCFSFVGEDLPLNAHYAIGNFIRDALYQDSITIKGSGSALRSYMYQEDLAHWLYEILIKGECGECYNVGSDSPVTIKELAIRVRNLLSKEKEIFILGGGDFKTNRYLPDVSKAKTKLSLNLKFDLDNAVLKTAQTISLKKSLT